MEIHRNDRNDSTSRGAHFMRSAIKKIILIKIK